MNKFFTTAQGFSKRLCFATLVAATLASCSSSSDELEGVNGSNNEGTTPVSLFSNVQGLTRSGDQDSSAGSNDADGIKVTGIQNDSFVAGETMYAWINDATTNDALYKAITLTAGANNALTASETLYYPVSGNNVKVYAIHGNLSNVSAGNAMPTSFSFSVKDDQSAKENYLASDLIYGSQEIYRTNNSHEISFNHKLSKVYFVIKAGNGLKEVSVDKIQIKDVVTNGTFAPASTPELTLGSTKGTITVRNVTEDEETTYHSDAIIIPQSLLSKTIEFTLGNGQIMSYKFPAVATDGLTTMLESGKQYRYTVTMSLTEITLTSKIVGWSDTTGGSLNAGMSNNSKL